MSRASPSNTSRATSVWVYSSPHKPRSQVPVQDRRRSAPLPKASGALSTKPRQYTALFEESDEGNESFSPPQTPPRSIKRNNNVSPALTRTGRGLRESLPTTPDRRLSHTLVSESPADHDTTNISGATLLALESDTEPLEIDPAHLSPLLDVSKAILSLLTAENISYKSILDVFKDRRFKSRLAKLTDKLNDLKASLGNKHLVPIPENAVPSLKPIVRKANLAQFAMDVVRPAPESYTGEHLSSVDDEFPSAFVSSVPRDSVRETFSLGLEIRTQRLIILLERLANRRENGDPEAMLRDVFYSVSIGSDRNLRGWEADGLEDEIGVLPEEFHDKVQNRIDSIREAFSGDTPNSVDIDYLYQKFGWAGFITRAAAWIWKQIIAVDWELDSHNSLQNAEETLRQRPGSVSRAENHRSVNASPIKRKGPLFAKWDASLMDPTRAKNGEASGAKSTKTVRTPAARKSFLSKAVIRHLQEREKNTSNQQTESHRGDIPRDNKLPSPVLDAGEGPSRRPETAGDIFKLAMAGAQRRSTTKQPASSALDIFKSAQAGHRILKTKERSISVNRAFIDRQANASRVSPIDSTQGSPREQTRRGDKRKRTATASVSGDSLFCADDDELQDDRRPAKQLRLELESFTSPERRVRASESIRCPANDAQGSDNDFEADQRPPRQRRIATARPPSASVFRARRAPAAARAPSRSVPINDGETDSDSSMSRAIRGSEELDVPRFSPSRGRRRWTDDEVKALEKYIKRYGTQFSYIKGQDSDGKGYLKGRTQVNLKDKARDLAFMYWKQYRNAAAMPENFQFVRLKQTQIQALEDMGIELPVELRKPQRG